ncbi:MAG TPA: polyphenol oxidase family protein [Solirubrobacteraceae bacterium]|nr:polyphenol oxidase family protein [Solirubrobacteraceae bacterium]
MPTSTDAGGQPAQLAGCMIALGSGAHAYFSARADGDLRRTGAALAATLGLRELHTLRQVHAAEVRVVAGALRVPAGGRSRAAPRQAEAGDALLCAEALCGVAVFAADCLPIALSGRRIVGAIHAGWRGLAAGVIEAAVARLRALGERGALRAVIGPGAGPCCYEVGAEVGRALGLDGAGRLDLAAIARRRALEAGVAHVRALERCTICDRSFFSHRREGGKAARQGVIVWREQS